MSSESIMDSKFCSNCKKDIAIANFTMHEVHCRRHLALCEYCQESFPRTELVQHFQDVHAKIPCTQCGTELEKDQLDSHMKDTCPKRPAACEYCELEMPYSVLQEHTQYCGTRTEACTRCGAFIMHKDSLRHESSNCTYPEQEAFFFNKKSVGGYQGLGGGDRNAHASFDQFLTSDLEFFSDPFSFDPFTFDGMSRALDGDLEREMPTSVVEDSDASAAAGEEKRVLKGREVMKARSKRVPVSTKNTVCQSNKSMTNQKSDVNRQREIEAEPIIPPDIDYDTMLALQLNAENDLDPDAHLNQLISKYEKHSRPQIQRNVSNNIEKLVTPASPQSFNEFDAADDMIPCEFCNEIFPSFALVHHQSVCEPLASGLWNQAEDTPSAFSRNNEALISRGSVSISRPVIPVLNNFESALPAQPVESHFESSPVSDNGDHINSLESIMLPCEFCGDLLPADVIVQHQAICEVDSFTTPRVTTPAAAQPSSTASHKQYFSTSFSHSRHRQSDPTEELWAAINQTEREKHETDTSLPHSRRRQPNSTEVWAALKQPKKENREPILPLKKRELDFTQKIPESSAFGASRTGLTGIDRPDAFRILERGNNDLSANNGRSLRKQDQVRIDRTTHTRHTLNRLLSDDVPVNQVDKTSKVSLKKSSSLGITGITPRPILPSASQGRTQRSQRGHTSDDVQETYKDAFGAVRVVRERGDRLSNNSINIRGRTSQKRTANKPDGTTHELFEDS